MNEKNLIGPIFIGGCDRSGTTMLAAMLGGHSAIDCLPESHFISEYAGTNEPPRDLVKRILGHERFRLWSIRVGDADVDALRRTTSYAELIGELAALYARWHGRVARPIWLDHAPRCVAAFQRLGERFPHARFIHLIRDGRAVAASWLQQDWGPRHVLTVADTWATRIAQGFAAELAMPDRVLRLHYEDVVRAPEETLRKVASFLSLEFEVAMLDARGFILPAHSKDTHALLAQSSSKGVSADRLDQWKNSLSPRQIGLFEQRTGDLLPLLGYPLSQPAPAGPTRTEYLHMLLSEAWGRLLNLRRRKQRHKVSYVQ